MASDSDVIGLEPDLFGVIRDRWAIIVVLAVILGLLGLFVGSTQSVEWGSTASVVVEDPTSSALFESGTAGRQDRYTETQIGIMSSPSVAEQASEVLASGSPSIDLEPDQVLEGSTVTSQDSSDLINVTFTADSAEVAERAADAIITAYLEARSSEAVEGFASALAQLDDSIVQSQQELDVLRDRIETLRGATVISVEQEAADAIARLIELQDAEDVSLEEISVIAEELQAFETLINIENRRPQLEALVEEQSLAMSRHSDLIARRNQVAVDAELAGGGFVFKTQATPAERINPSARSFAIVGVVIGIIGGVALAYALAIWRRRVSSPGQPESILKTPALGTIPEFDVTLHTSLPVANAPHSRPAEAFRFVMAAVESQLFRSPGGTLQAVGDRMVLVTSTSTHDGRSSLVANMATAAARSGRRVLVIDSDFTTQGVTQMLLPESADQSGITEVVIGATSLEGAIKEVPIIPGGELFILSRGSDLIGAQDIFGSSEIASMLDEVRQEFDLILVDTPPLPQVGYATTLARLADRVLIVVRHRTQVSRLEELRRRLSLVQTREIGYVYNRAPSTGDSRRPPRQAAGSRPIDEGSDTAPADSEILEQLSDR